MLDQPAVHCFAQLGGRQPALFLLDVMAGLDHFHRRRERTGPADPELLQRLDQRCLRVAGRRLGEVLFRLELLQVERLVDRQRGQLPLLVVVGVPLPDPIKAVEHEHRSVGSKHVIGGADVDSGLGEPRRGHLAGGEALPDQSIEPELVRGQKRANRIRGALDIGWTDRLVGILDRALGLELHFVATRVGRAVTFGDEMAGRGRRIVRDPERVGAHVGDQAHRPLRSELDTFVQLLRQTHGPVRFHPQPVGRILLQGARLVGRRGVPSAVLGFDRQHLVAGTLELRHDVAHLGLFFEFELLLVALLAQ